MGQLLSQPITEKNITLVQHDHISHSIGEMQGYRLTMEDAYSNDTTITTNTTNTTNTIPRDEIHDENIEKLKINIYGVFDGHGGSSASKFISEHLPFVLRDEIIQQINSLSLEDKLKLCHCQDILKLINFPLLLKSVFLKCDSMFYSNQGNNSGSTAVVVLIFQDYIFVANSGDSRCILSMDGATKQLSFDHKPKNLGELMRIHGDGGYVKANRVNSILALSRAFGDFTFKMHNDHNHSRLILSKSNPRVKLTPPEEYQVTVEPDIIMHKVTQSDEFLVIACDGIWDCYKSHDLINLIRHQLSLGKKLPEINEMILDNCIGMANTITGIGFDNMTLIIVALHEKQGDLNNWYGYMKNKILDER
ncbi:hypothetical protein CANARDRAFT_181901, partial [[Candida] arabinofermentans NRRL YB-2248]